MRILSVLLLKLFLLVPVWAQESGSTPDQTPAEPAAEEAAPLPDTVTNPDISAEILQIRLLPLTQDELAEAAAQWLQIVKGKTEEVADTMATIAEAGDNATAQQRERLATLTAQRKALFDNYSKVIAAWSLKGGDPAAIKPYEAYQTAIFVDEVRTSDVTTLIRRAGEWAMASDGGLELLRDIVVILLSMLALFFVARLVRRIAGRGINRVPNLSKLLQAFLLVAIYWFTVAIGLMVVLSALGVDITPLFAVVGGASFILAFALQDTLGNLAAGLMIMINRPFDEGDYVDIAGTAGTVQKMNIVSTTVTTPDNQIILIPNGKVWGNIITNVTGSKLRRVDLVFGIGYSDSVAKAQELLEAIVAEHPLTLSDPAAVIRVHALGESSVDFIVRPWVKSEDYWTVYWDMTRTVKERFDEAGITIPFPQRDIHIHPAAIEANLPASTGAGAG